MGTAVRPAALAGRFYPGQAYALAREIDAYVEAAQPVRRALDGLAPKMLLVPHAGYIYSGPVAGSAYACLAPLRGRVRRVVLLGPAHRVAVRGLAAPQAGAFETPLGRVTIDAQALALLDDLPQVGVSDLAHAEEHSLEVQLPFLQRALGAFDLVPLAVGRATPDEVAEVLERLWGGDETLVVISSDLSHYLPYAEARRRDEATVARVLALDPALDHDEACGATPLAGALLAARRHGLAARRLDLRNSGDTAGDRQRVVGYAAVAFVANAPHARDLPEPAVAEPTTATAASTSTTGPVADAALGRALLARARNAIADALGLTPGVEPPHPELRAPGATFVTLRHRGALRGCIGALAAERTLDEDVRRHARAAAFDDPRFAPITQAEFAALEIEVSLLDAAEALAVTSEAEAQSLLRRGRDGVILEWRDRRATFLPQVWEQLPQPAQFLAALKRKAGLAADFWAADLRLSRYGVRKFSEPADAASA